MLAELKEVGKELDDKGELFPPGYYPYRKEDSIKWVVVLGPASLYLEQSALDVPRPNCGRSSNVAAHLLVDQAAYVLGVDRSQKGIDKNAGRKHAEYRALLLKFQQWPGLQDDGLREAVGWIERALNEHDAINDERFSLLDAKDWVSIRANAGPLYGQHLFQHREAQMFWDAEMRERTVRLDKRKRPIEGPCSVCGEYKEMLARLPLDVKLGATSNPLAGFNAGAFPSFVQGISPDKTAHIGVCYDCGDLAARAFNYLSGRRKNRRTLVRDPRGSDKLGNQTALFWEKRPVPLVAVEPDGAEIEVDDDIIIEAAGDLPDAPVARSEQLDRLLALPWKRKGSTADDMAAFNLDDYGFYLAILSPNVGRIAVRDWMALGITSAKESLRRYRDAARIIGPWAEPPSVPSVVTMLEAIGAKSPDWTNRLLRTTYAGVPPPANLAAEAAVRLGHVLQHEASLKERQRGRGGEADRLWSPTWLHALAAAVKLGLYYGRAEESEAMQQLTEGQGNPAYTVPYYCGRLLALLERAQQIHYRKRSVDGKYPKVTIVTRGYGGIAAAPKTGFAGLMPISTTAHLPEAGWLNPDVEDVQATIVSLGGYPETLSLAEQGEFGLGFYHQRALLRQKAGPEDQPNEENTSDDEQQ